MRKHLFSERVVKHCNRLPAEVVDAPSLTVFERRLDHAFKNILNLWPALNLSGQLLVGLDDPCRSLPAEIIYSIRFDSIRFDSIPFHSIPFCSLYQDGSPQEAAWQGNTCHHNGYSSAQAATATAGFSLPRSLAQSNS